MSTSYFPSQGLLPLACPLGLSSNVISSEKSSQTIVYPPPLLTIISAYHHQCTVLYPASGYYSVYWPLVFLPSLNIEQSWGAVSVHLACDYCAQYMFMKKLISKLIQV